LGASGVVATLPPADEYGEMVVTSTHAYVVANRGTSRVLLRIELASGTFDLVTIRNLSNPTLVRQHGASVAWNDGSMITVTTPTGTKTVNAPFNFTTLGGYDFDAHHVFVSGSGRQTLALGLDGSPDTSWPEY